MSPFQIARALVVILCLSFAAPAGAEPPPPNDAGEEEREAFMSRLRMMRMYAFTEALELDEPTATKLFPYLREGDAAIESTHRDIRGHRKALRELASEDSLKDSEIDAHITAISALEQRMTTLRAEQIDGLKGILSPQQRVRFILTHARIERELRSALRDRRRQGNRQRTRGAKE